MRKSYIFKALVIILAIAVSYSCNILSPENIPNANSFIVGSVKGDVTLIPITAYDGVAFGGFSKRFKYQGQWHMLVTNVYNYDSQYKTTTQRSQYALIRLDSASSFTIVGENLHNSKVDNYSSRSVWYMLNDYSWNIDGTKLTYEDPNNVENSEKYYRAYNDTLGYSGNWNDNVIDSYYRTNTYNYTYTDNLIDWYYKDDETERENIIEFPLPESIGGDKDSWQGYYGLSWTGEAIFQNYIYVLGGVKITPSMSTFGTISETTIKRKRVDNALGRNDSDWEVHPVDFTAAYRNGSTIKESIKISKNKNKLFFSFSYKWNATAGSYYTVDEEIWSTTDGITWTQNSVGYDDADDIDSAFTDYTKSYTKAPLTVAALEPDWAYSSSRSSYFQSYENDFVSRSIDTSTVPTDDIKTAVSQGKTSFDVTTEDIAANAYDFDNHNNFLVSADSSSWKNILIGDDVKQSMNWLTLGDWVFEIDGQIIRFVDYDKLYTTKNSGKNYEDLFVLEKSSYYSTYTSLMNSYSQSTDLATALGYKYRAD